MSKNKTKLKPKEKNFVKEYLEIGNGTQAVLNTNPSITTENSAAVAAHRLLRKDKVREYLEDKAEQAATRIQELSEQGENLTVALGASKDIMDRAGFKPVDRTDLTTNGKDLSLHKEQQSVIDNALNNI